MTSDSVIGVDFDNTIADYDDLLHRIVSEKKLIDTRRIKGKKAIRDMIRQLPDGEIEWQKLQGVIYGQRMAEARRIKGVLEFLSDCNSRKIKTYIVSHKTIYANYDETRTNLREAALTWLKANRFLEKRMTGLSAADVFFESTREDKISRIIRLGCTHFIDDLEETFLEPSFPASVVKILYAPHHKPHIGEDVVVKMTWRDITGFLLHETGPKQHRDH